MQNVDSNEPLGCAGVILLERVCDAAIHRVLSQKIRQQWNDSIDTDAVCCHSSCYINKWCWETTLQTT